MKVYLYYNTSKNKDLKYINLGFIVNMIYVFLLINDYLKNI